ncbi:SpoIIE family protein phosphatase [Pseudonocardia sp.]|uniref:SpoIIE family protein phosphatase n=1 Tax=Pseudonocardia sp. TaxID=60912 RepID=UPI003D0CED51
MTAVEPTGAAGPSPEPGAVPRAVLGAGEGRPAALRTAIEHCRSSVLPSAVLWGPDLAAVANDAAVTLMGDPSVAGGGPEPAGWAVVKDAAREVLATGAPVRREQEPVTVIRQGRGEEVYLTLACTPIRTGEDGPCAGVLVVGLDVTGHVLGRRRLATLRRLGELSAAGVRTPEQACAAAVEVLADNRADTPFATVHLVDRDSAAEPMMRLVASHGLDGPAAGEAVIPVGSQGSALARVVRTGSAEVLTETAEAAQHDPGHRTPGTGRGPGVADTAMLLPLLVAGSARPVGVITIGVRHRQLDEDCRAFLELVARQVGAAVADALSAAAQLRAESEHAAAQRLRERAETERAARDAAEALAARLRSLVDGLAAVVWEIDARSEKVVFVSERVEELTGHPAQGWLGPQDFWRSLIHPEDRERVAARHADGIAGGVDFDVPAYRLRAADGHTVWCQDLVHVALGPDGAVERLQGVMVDVTAQERARQVTALLAEIGRADEGGPLAARLTTLLRLSVPAMADLGAVSALGPDGMLRPLAAVSPGRPDVERQLLAGAGAYPLSPALRDRYDAGEPFVVATPTDADLRAFAAGESDYALRRDLRFRSALIVPLVVGGRMRGTLSMVTTDTPREYDAGDLTLAAELGRRAALMLEAERLGTRERRLVEITTALAAAGTVAEAARVMAAGVRDTFGASAVAAYLRDPALGLRVVHSSGYPDLLLRHYGVVRPEDDQPVGVCARTAEPVWLRSDADWRARFPHLTEHHAVTGNEALMALPMLVGGRVVGALAASFATRRTFDPDEQQFARTVCAHAAQAFERAALADTRREIAETLQHSLLPAELPTIERLGLAARYEPGAHGSQAGGDWYEVLPLGERKVAIVVGDVVGQGAAAAAVMGQLRSALAAALLDGCGPAAALTRLDRFARRIAGARASTVACLVLDVGSGYLRWARAGHPPPLVLADGDAEYLDGPSGRVLGAGGGFTEAGTTLPAGAVLLLYTDGLIERRGEVIDDGLRRLRRAALAAAGAAPNRLIDEVLARTLHPAGPPDDVAVIAARLGPEPLHLRIPARAEELRGLRRSITEWMTAAGLAREPADDLQLAVGEAVANSVEHAYPEGTTGAVEVELRLGPGGAIDVLVRDFGTWRPPPVDRGYRGRGLDLIRLLGSDAAVEPGPGGTVVRFRMAARPVPAGADPVSRARPVSRTRLRVLTGDGARRAVLTGELDLAGVAAVREDLVSALADDVPVVLDVTGLTYLGSAGVGMLVEALDRDAVTLRVPADGPVRAVLDLVGIAPGPG